MGFVAGIDMTPDGRASRVGIAGGWGESNLDLRGRASSGWVTSGFGALYGPTQLGAVVLRAGVIGAGHDIDTTRDVAFPSFSESDRAKYGGYTAQVFGELALPIPVAAGTWTSCGALAEPSSAAGPE